MRVRPSLILIRILFCFQQFLLFLSYFLHVIFRCFFPLAPLRYVVGVTEIACYLRSLSVSLNSSFSVCLYPNRLYSHHYDFCLPVRNKYLAEALRFFIGPILLGRLVHQAETFIYLWNYRYLIAQVDQGQFEYRFIKYFNKKLVLIYLGSDIRSPMLTMDFANSRGDEVEAHYYFLSRPSSLASGYESIIERRCRVSEAYADFIFTARVDQASYFKRPTFPLLYFYPDSAISKNPFKYSGDYRPRIVHAPSSPLTKGTPLVRSAIARLRIEGYNFEYIELIGVSNDVVLFQLSSAHIVLNEFYALVPGVFGIEAMASYCALMTSADETIETDLPPGSNQAWLVTKSYEVYDNLKMLLDNPILQASYAKAGYEWALAHAAESVSAAKFSSIIDS